MPENVTKHLFLGLPESGKTTFLAALWYYIRHDHSDTGLTADALPAERAYLNGISDEWMRGKTQTHTRVAANIVDVTLRLRNRETDIRSELHIPDLSGELFTHHWADRCWSTEFNDLAALANGVLLFVHPNRLEGPLTILEINAAEGLLSDGEDADRDVEDAANAPQEFDPLCVPPQVVLVDQLQCLVGQPCQHEMLKLSVVISAWDELDDKDTCPRDWIRLHAPLLFQFITANHRRIDVRVFGISAQGGDYTNENVRRGLTLLPNPIDRITVFDGTDESHDITRPVRWMM
jgi:hypothetical protein